MHTQCVTPVCDFSHFKWQQMLIYLSPYFCMLQSIFFITSDKEIMWQPVFVYQQNNPYFNKIDE